MNKIKNYFRYSLGSSLASCKSSILAILCGLLAASVLMLISNVNPIKSVFCLFVGGFNHFYIKETMANFAIYGLAGLAIAISFKSGIFNIGVTGQMLIGGGLAAYIGIVASKVNGGGGMHFLGIIVCVVVAAIAGSLTAIFAGLLKVWFRVHEVVSTILLNWAIYYFIRFLFRPFAKSAVHKPATINSSPIGHIWRLVISNNGTGVGWIVGIILLLLCAVIVYYIINLSKTGFGFRMLGANRDASKYSGLSIKTNTIITMGISGAIAGIAGAVLYCGYIGYIPNFQAFPQFGFIAIAIALLGFNNPIGVLFAALFYAAMKSGGSYAQAAAGVNQTIMQLSIGTIIYFAALSALFIKFKPIIWLRKTHFRLCNKEFNVINKTYQENVKNLKNKYKTIIDESKILFLENRHKGFAMIKENQQEIYDIQKTIDYKKADFEEKEAQISNLKKDLNDDLKEMGYSKHYENKKLFQHNLKMLKQELKLNLEEKFNKYKLVKNKRSVVDNVA